MRSHESEASPLHRLLGIIVTLSLACSLVPLRTARAEDGATPVPQTPSVASVEASPDSPAADMPVPSAQDPSASAIGASGANAHENGSAGAASDAALAPGVAVAEYAGEGEQPQGPADELALAPLAADASIADVVARMTLDEKISQMIVPAIRAWDGQALTSLAAAPQLAAALAKHQYGGIILYASNVASVPQLSELVNALQANNWQASVSAHIPYLMMVDEEGGLVTRLTMGTRMTGSMAIGATGERAEENAYVTGRILGEEIMAVGLGVDFAPTIDVNSNPANPVIGTRSFSDDPSLVARLGMSYVRGLRDAGAVATLKHFPGHGDTGTDSHTTLPSVDKTLSELEACEFAPFREAIAAGAELIMTAHVTLPLVDDLQTFGDGSTGHFPATMSRKVMTDILRGQLGYQGVIITDAIEMAALYTSQFVETSTVAPEGETRSQRLRRLSNDPTYCANLAEKIIEAGVDILLLPRDLTDADAADFYDAYIGMLAQKAEGDPELMARIDESVGRILALKEAHGITAGEPAAAVDAAAAQRVVGSPAHHEEEMRIAREAVTLVKNEDRTLPYSAEGKKVVVLGRFMEDITGASYAVGQLKELGLIDADTCVHNLVDGTTQGSPDSDASVTFDYYCGFDSQDEPIAHYSDELAAAIGEADLVVCYTAATSMWPLTKDAPLYQCVSRALAETHAAGGKFVLMSNNLPYDAARYQDADAIVCTYMSSGAGMDPTARTETGQPAAAFNANMIAGLESIFDHMPPNGNLPVSIPVIDVAEDGSISYSKTETLYQRGHGLSYEYAFVEGMGGTHKVGEAADLAFKENARFDLLGRVLVDGAELAADDYVAAKGSTTITLKATYLDALAAGEHTLTAVHGYEPTPVEVSCSFTVTRDEGSKPEPDPAPTPAPTPAASRQGSASAKLPATSDIAQPVAAVASMAVVLIVVGVARRRRAA